MYAKKKQQGNYKAGYNRKREIAPLLRPALWFIRMEEKILNEQDKNQQCSQKGLVINRKKYGNTRYKKWRLALGK